MLGIYLAAELKTELFGNYWLSSTANSFLTIIDHNVRGNLTSVHLHSTSESKVEIPATNTGSNYLGETPSDEASELYKGRHSGLAVQTSERLIQIRRNQWARHPFFVCDHCVVQWTIWARNPRTRHPNYIGRIWCGLSVLKLSSYSLYNDFLLTLAFVFPLGWGNILGVLWVTILAILNLKWAVVRELSVE